jgi:type III secretion system YscI/HrpB-like protein
MIEAVNATIPTSADVSLNMYSQPTVAEAEAFAQVLANAKPDNGLMQTLALQSQRITQSFASVQRIDEIVSNPIEMLKTQKDFANMSAEVDLLAKVAGSVSQSINKLVHMQ